MSIAEMLGTPVRDAAEATHEAEPTCSVPPPPDKARPERTRRIGWTWMFLVGVLALAIGFGAGAYLSSSPAAAESTADSIVASQTVPPAIGGFAEMVTALQLSGLADPADLATLYAGTPPTTEVGGLWINRSAAISTESLGPDYWVVTVAVDALEMQDGAYEAAGIQYYEITIATDGDRPVAVSAPARIPSPAVAAVPAGVPTFGGAVPADQAVAATSFLDTYLTGSGEVARFVSPTSRIQLFPEAPYETIEVLSLGADSLGRIKAAVAASTSRGGRQHLEYTLELTFESGVWEVFDLVAAANDRS